MVFRTWTSGHEPKLYFTVQVMITKGHFYSTSLLCSLYYSVLLFRLMLSDNNYKMKLVSGDKSVEACQPNPCQYNGKCIANNGSSFCQCMGHYTGRYVVPIVPPPLHYIMYFSISFVFWQFVDFAVWICANWIRVFSELVN